ncbi:MAG: histidine kinase [Actinomycetota bacterium]
MSGRWRLGAAVVTLVTSAALFGLEYDDPDESGSRLFVGVPMAMVGAGLLTSARGSRRLGGAKADEPDSRPPSLVINLGTSGDRETARDALRRALGDPELDIVYPRVGAGGWIDEVGDATGSTGDAGTAFTPIARGGKPVAGLLHDPALLGDPDRLRAAVESASLAIDNERLKAQVHAQLAEVQASRARIVDAGDRELRRVERNLHDGAQQRLVGLALVLRLASRRVGDRAVGDLIAEAAREADDALAELRELARGIHPAIVDDAGIEGAIETLAERPGVPVELHLDVPERLPQPVEVGAYYLVAEALANVNKHAHARRVSVEASVAQGVLQVTVSDDGAGGAVPAPGSGLEGLADRVSALGGELRIDSPRGGGTVVAAAIPLAAPSDTEVERRRLTALKWIGWENWEVPGELYEQITEEDNLMAAKAVLLCAGGNSRLTAREREWLIGYHTAAGSSDRVIELIETYDDSDTVEAMMGAPGMALISGAMVYDALRACCSDGPLTHDELDRLARGAAAMGIAPDAFAALREVVDAELALRSRRYELVTAPVLPGHRRAGGSEGHRSGDGLRGGGDDLVEDRLVGERGRRDRG